MKYRFTTYIRRCASCRDTFITWSKARRYCELHDGLDVNGVLLGLAIVGLAWIALRLIGVTAP